MGKTEDNREKERQKYHMLSLMKTHTHTKKADGWLFGRMGPVDTGRMK